MGHPVPGGVLVDEDQVEGCEVGCDGNAQEPIAFGLGPPDPEHQSQEDGVR